MCTAWMEDMPLRGTVEVLLRVPIRWDCGFHCSIRGFQIGCPRPVLLTAWIGTGSQRRTGIAVEPAAAHCTSIATCTVGNVVASGGLACTPVGTGTAGHVFAALSTAGQTHSRSSPTRVGSPRLQTKGQMWKAESSRVAHA